MLFRLVSLLLWLFSCLRKSICIFVVWLPFLNLSETVGVPTIYVPRGDDGSSAPITIPNLFPFGTSLQPQIYVSISYIHT